MSGRSQHRKRTRPGETPHAETARVAAPPKPPEDRLRPWLLAAAAGLWVVRPLYPSEGAFLGDGLPVVMLWLVLAVVWLAGTVARRRTPAGGWSRLRFGWVDAGVLLVITLHSLSALWAVAHASPRPAVNMLWEWIALGVGFFLTRQLVDSPREARAMVVVMVALAVALACYGPYQTYVGMAQDRQLFRDNPDEALRLAGIWYPEGSPQRETFRNRLDSMEPLATFALTNSLAGYLAPWLVIMLGIGISGLRASPLSPFSPSTSSTPSPPSTPSLSFTPSPSFTLSTPSPPSSLCALAPLRETSPLVRRRWLAELGIAVLPVAGCLVLTQSRSGCLAALVGIVALAFATWGRRIRISRRGLAIGAAVVTLLVVAAIAARGLPGDPWGKATKSLGYRVQYWRSTAAMIADYPWLGCGPGNFKDAYTAYKLPEASEEVADPHNFVLEVWATAGMATMLALVATLGGFFWVALRGSCSPDSSAQTHSVAPGEDAGQKGSTGQTRMSVLRAGPLFVLGGGLAGFLAALPIAVLVGAPAQLAVLVIGLPTAVATGAVLLGWIDRGPLPSGLTAVGVLVLLVDLMASGGIGFAGVAGTLWVLMALGLNLQADAPGRRLPRWAAMGLLAAAIGLAVACYLSGYDPVLRCRAAMEAALYDIPRRGVHLVAAQAADPLAAEPWNQLAALALAEWEAATSGTRPAGAVGADSKAALQLVEYCTQSAIQRAPKDAELRFAAAVRHEAVFAKTKDRALGRAFLDKGIEYYRAAVQFYPNKALFHGRLALAYAERGDLDSTAEEATTAIWLDNACPHADKKLDSKLRKSLERIVSKRD